MVGFERNVPGVSVWKVSVASQPPSSRHTRVLEEAKKEESLEWALPVELGRWLTHADINKESLETSKVHPLRELFPRIQKTGA